MKYKVWFAEIWEMEVVVDENLGEGKRAAEELANRKWEEDGYDSTTYHSTQYDSQREDGLGEPFFMVK